MIWIRIQSGETAEEIGIHELQYESRKKTLGAFFEEWNGEGFWLEKFLEWLPEYGERDIKPVPAEKISRGFGDTIARMTTAVGITPCGGCKKRQAKLNKLFPYKT